MTSLFFLMVFGDRVYIPGWFPSCGNSVSGLRGMLTRSGLFNFETGFHYEAQGGFELMIVPPIPSTNDIIEIHQYHCLLLLLKF